MYDDFILRLQEELLLLTLIEEFNDEEAYDLLLELRFINKDEE
jgi:hypothetical protein